jgi:hypothetical protein
VAAVAATVEIVTAVVVDAAAAVRATNSRFAISGDSFFTESLRQEYSPEAFLWLT